MSSLYQSDTEKGLKPQPTGAASPKSSRSARRKLAYGALAIWLVHAAFAWSAAPASDQTHGVSVAVQVGSQVTGWKDWVKWHCKPLPKDPRERALALLTRYPIIGMHNPPTSPDSVHCLTHLLHVDQTGILTRPSRPASATPTT